MTLRGSVPGFVAVGSVLLLAACNDSKLVSGASCPTNPSSSSVSSAVSAPTAAGNPGLRVKRAPMIAIPVAQDASAGDATPASATQLVAAMDVPGASSPTLTGKPLQAAAFNGLGSLNPTHGSNMAWLSTGIAGAQTNKSLQATDPLGMPVVTQPGTNVFDQLDPLDMGGGCAADSGSYDCASLQFSVTVPSGAHSLAFDFNFMSAEYPEFVGSNYNDQFLAKEESPSFTFDNVSYDAAGHPININNVFFTETCQQLTGTGYDIFRQLDPSACDAGGTGMLTTVSPVAPGETVTMTFTIYDKHDGWLDSAVMIDNFRFDPQPVTTPVTTTPTPTPAPSPTATPAC